MSIDELAKLKIIAGLTIHVFHFNSLACIYDPKCCCSFPTPLTSENHSRAAMGSLGLPPDTLLCNASPLFNSTRRFLKVLHLSGMTPLWIYWFSLLEQSCTNHLLVEVPHRLMEAALWSVTWTVQSSIVVPMLSSPQGFPQCFRCLFEVCIFSSSLYAVVQSVFQV